VAKGPRLPEFEIAGRSGQFSLNESRLTRSGSVWSGQLEESSLVWTLDAWRLAGSECHFWKLRNCFQSGTAPIS
jgi:hypothetical protein